MPRRLGCPTAAPCSSSSRHTSSFPLPAAAVRAAEGGGVEKWRGQGGEGGREKGMLEKEIEKEWGREWYQRFIKINYN